MLKNFTDENEFYIRKMVEEEFFYKVDFEKIEKDYQNFQSGDL